MSGTRTAIWFVLISLVLLGAATLRAPARDGQQETTPPDRALGVVKPTAFNELAGGEITQIERETMGNKQEEDADDDDNGGDDDGHGEGDDDDEDEDTIPLKEAKLNIEHNATDEDTGFQGAIDSEGWERLDVIGPDGIVLTLQGRGELRTLGLTELFFETVEPANADVPIEDLLAVLPEGLYTIEGPSVDGVETEGTALLTHDIPAGPVLLSPAEGATVPPSNLVMSWSPVTQTINGDPITIIRYQLIVEVDEPVHPHAIGKRGMSIYVPQNVTSVTVPNEFLEAGTHYLWEVLAIEESGNQTLSSSEFDTQ